MQILMITENDPAGMAIAFSNAVNQYTAHGCRVITSQERYGFDYQTDIHIPDMEQGHFEEIEQLLIDSDIIHFHMLSDENLTLGHLKIKDYINGKALVHHHHGHPEFRSNPAFFRDKYEKLNRKVIVSTPDLLHLLPNAEWLPNIVPIDHVLYRPKVKKVSEKILICQSPTRKDLKNTEAFIEIVKGLKKTYENILLKIIDFTPHLDCLRIKQKADINFDHMQGYFGVSSLESLSMGVTTIAGLDEWNRGWIKKKIGVDHLPWIIVRNAEELSKSLTRLIKDKDLREETGRESRLFMETHWSEKKIVNYLIGFYNTL
ncbi:MAG: hypothetical protein PF503_22705 [Desulfobacula sp.]|nr:hypothetical protein [Desulfobacula sp.]